MYTKKNNIKLTLIKCLLLSKKNKIKSLLKKHYKIVGIPSDYKVRKTKEYMKCSARGMDKNAVQSLSKKRRKKNNDIIECSAVIVLRGLITN